MDPIASAVVPQGGNTLRVRAAMRRPFLQESSSMDTPLEIAFHNIESSDALEQKIRDRVDRMHRFFHHINSVRVAVEAPHRSQVNAQEFHVRIVARVPDDELVVSRDPGDRWTHHDAFLAVRDAFEAMEKQLEAHSQKVRGDVKHHPMPPQGRVRRLFPDYGFIATTDHREIYFHRNALVDADFDSLKEGTPVELTVVYGESPEGPQATTVRPIRETEFAAEPINPE